MSGGLAPCGVARQILEEVFAGGREFVSDEAQPEEPAAEGVLGVVGLGASRAGGARGQGLGADGQAKLDVGFDLARVEGGLEGAELDGVCRTLLGEGRVEVEQVVAAGVVVPKCAAPPVGVASVRVGVPDPCEVLHGLGLDAVQLLEEEGLDRFAPAASALGGDSEGHGQKVFLRVDDVDQVSKCLGGVRAQPDVDVDSAGFVDPGAGIPKGSDLLLDHLDVLPAAHRADHLRRGVGDRTVALDRPVPPIGHVHFPVVQVVSDVPCRRSEEPCDGLCCASATEAGGFDLDAESLSFHGVASFFTSRGVRPAA